MKLLDFFAVAFIALLPSVSLVAQKGTGSCSVKPGSYLGWDAQIVTNRWVTLTFVPQLGGRLMQVEFNGHPYLFTNSRFRGKYISPADAKGDWINYGGDKIWPMPEGSQDENHWVIQSTAIDDLPYLFETLSKGKECTVRLTGQPDTITGMRIVRTVSLDASTPEIRFHAVMENVTAHPITWSIQSVTQYDLEDAGKPGEFNHDLWAFTPRNIASSFPDGYHVRYGLAEDPAFSTREDLFRLHWTYFGNEVWLDTTAGWLAVVDKTSHYGMVETFEFKKGEDYPGKTTVIFYKNGPSVRFDEKGAASIAGATPTTTPYYMEAEVNSPIVTLSPGGSYTFDTLWHPVRITAEPQEMHASGIVVQKLEATSGAGEIHLRGDFSTFFPGRLVAVVYSNRGSEISHHEIQVIDPAHPIELNATIPLPERASRIALKVFGLEDEDRGILAVAQIDSK